jgi:uncharacterized protein (TIGR03437 family)
MSGKARTVSGGVLIGLATIPIVAWCQTPVISAVVNSASYEATLGSPGSIVAIFGTNLAAATATAQSVPLPRQLGGARVTWNGVAAPLFYVSPTQINFQVPSPNDTTPGVLVIAGVVVSTDAGNSVPFAATPNARDAAGIFSVDASGCGQGAVLNVANDGSVSLNSAANSASPGGWISVYGTGITLLAYPPDGVPTPLTPLFTSNPTGGALFDFQGLLNAPLPGFVGLAPGLVGVSQFNTLIPATVREGCAVPLQFEYFGVSNAISQPVTLAIRNGGGPCVDPPAPGYGQIVWQKTVTTTAANTASESDTLTVSLQASPGQQAPPAPVYSDGCDQPGLPANVCEISLPISFTYFGPSCPVPGYRGLVAGTVTLQGPGLSPAQAPVIPFQQGQLGGLSEYQAALPNGAIQAGKYTVTASGGADVGAFQATAQVGADIQIQTALAGARVWGDCEPLTINWTGGDPNSWVTVSMVQQAPASNGGYQWVNFAYRTPTSKGAMTIPYPLASPPGCPQGGGQSFTISIEVDPDPSEITAFSASGLSLGGQVTWRYLHTFQGTLFVD